MQFHKALHQISMRVLFLLFLIFTFQSFSQDSLFLRLQVSDEKTGEAIANVAITAKQGETTYFAKTNQKGKAHLTVLKGVEINLACGHSQLNPYNQRISASKLRGDTLDMGIQMSFIRTQNHDEIVVKAPGIPAVVFESSRLHVEDFEFLADGNLLLLTYPKRLKKGSEVLLYNGKRILQALQVPDVAEELVRDFRGNAHVLCKDNVFGVYAKGQSVEVSVLPRDYFVRYVAPIIDTNHSKMYFSNFNPDYPAFDYFSFDQIDSTYSKLLSIEDELMMELYRSEYKWVDVRTKLWAREKEMESGIDAEIWVGAAYFTQSPYYKELYAPLFHRNDSLFVFDYYKDSLFTLNAQGERISAIPIYHHYRKKQSGWKSHLIQDRVTGEIYAIYDRAGFTFLGRIDVHTGEITEQVSLHHRYVNKVQVNNNEVYYTYRPFESIQKKYLYKERLPYDFGKAKVIPGELEAMEE